jgi:hypothetical protein
MRALESRLRRLESSHLAGDSLDAARPFARVALEIKTGHKIADGPLLDRLTTWGARHGLSIKAHLDAMAQVDRMASYVSEDEPVPGTGECTNVFGMGAAELLALLDAGQVDDRDLLTLYGFQPQE